MDFNLEKELQRLEEKLVKECVWVLDRELMITRNLDSTRYNISINDKIRWDKQHVDHFEFSDFEMLIQVLQHFGMVNDFVKKGLFHMYDKLVKEDAKSFVLNVYEYPHFDKTENYEISY